MTFYAFRYNIEPMFFGIAIVMVVMLRLIATFTFYGSDLWQCAISHGASNSLTSEAFCLMAGYVLFLGSPALIACPVTTPIYKHLLACVRCLLICEMANITMSYATVLGPVVPVKLRNVFNFIALRTLFCYDGFRHNQFPKNWLCFEPLESQPLCGFSALYHNSRGCQA